jgi:hypothetical protein
MRFIKYIFNSETKPKEASEFKFSDNYLFETHSKEEIRRWNSQLKYGFFKRAWGGHANDGNEFGISLKFDNENELLHICKSLNIKLKLLPENYPKPIKGKGYTPKEYQKFKNEITDFPQYEQPSHIKLNDSSCHCWISNQRIRLTIHGASGNSYEVIEKDFEFCLKIETLITKKGIAKYVDFNFENSSTIISRERYPELFSKKKIRIELTRESVCMGDDVNAPNKSIINLTESETLLNLTKYIFNENYLANISGGKATWVMKINNDKNIAVLAQQWSEQKYLINGKTPIKNFLINNSNNILKIHFDYLAQQNPEIKYQELKKTMYNTV